MSDGKAGAAGGGAIYSLGIFGAWIFFWEQADGFFGYVWAIAKGLIWPAYMVYNVFDALLNS